MGKERERKNGMTICRGVCVYKKSNKRKGYRDKKIKGPYSLRFRRSQQLFPRTEKEIISRVLMFILRSSCRSVVKLPLGS